MRIRFATSRVLVAVTVVLFVAPAGAQDNTKFRLPDGCTFPFKDIAKKRTIDNKCGPAGNASTSQGRAQNRMKNNFCSTGTPVELDLDAFELLHTIVKESGIKYGSGNKLPDDRDELKESS